MRWLDQSRIRRKLAQSSRLLPLSCSTLGVSGVFEWERLYPDVGYITFEDYVKEFLDGKVKGYIKDKS